VDHICSLFGFIVLHMLMYAGNIYFWRRYRVNYSFIFGFKEGTEMGYLEVLLLSFGLATLALASVLSNLDMHSPHYDAFTELLPLNLVFVRLYTTFFLFFTFRLSLVRYKIFLKKLKNVFY
jgi:hypothetical protein